MVEYKIKNVLKQAELSSVRLKGSVEEQMEIFFRNRVLSDYAKSSIYRETEDAFRNQIDDAKGVGYWQGEFWGKWVISACRVAKYERNSELKAFLNNAALTLISLAREDGYIGTYKKSENVLPTDPEIGKRVLGWPCVWNWNVWCRKYTLWGLLEVYMLTDDERILKGARRFADQLISELEKLGVSLQDCGTFSGMPAGSIIKPMLILYRLTSDEKYLSFVKKEVALWEREDGKCPNIVSNLLAMKPIYTWYKDPPSWAKAYEMMSCLDGLCELYRVSGEEKYLTAVKNAHALIKEYEMNNVYGMTCNDIFYGSKEYQNSCTEPCDLIHWMRLCFELYMLTADPVYMDDIEICFYNPFLAGSFDDGKWGARAVRSSGRHIIAEGQAGMKESHCCVNNMPRGYLNFAETALCAKDGEAILNVYTEHESSIDTDNGRVSVNVSGDYLKLGRVTVNVNAEKSGVLSLRIPAWSKNAEIKAFCKTYVAKGGEYFKLQIPEGDSNIEIFFHMEAMIREFGDYTPDDERLSYAKERFISPYMSDYCAITEKEMVFDKRATVTYGPLLLTKSRKCGNTVEEIFTDKTVAQGGYKATVTPLEENGTRVKFNVNFDNGKDSFDVVMCDYATGSNEIYKVDAGLFSIFV